MLVPFVRGQDKNETSMYDMLGVVSFFDIDYSQGVGPPRSAAHGSIYMASQTKPRDASNGWASGFKSGATGSTISATKLGPFSFSGSSSKQIK